MVVSQNWSWAMSLATWPTAGRRLSRSCPRGATVWVGGDGRAGKPQGRALCPPRGRGAMPERAACRVRRVGAGPRAHVGSHEHRAVGGELLADDVRDEHDACDARRTAWERRRRGSRRRRGTWNRCRAHDMCMCTWVGLSPLSSKSMPLMAESALAPGATEACNCTGADDRMHVRHCGWSPAHTAHCRPPAAATTAAATATRPLPPRERAGALRQSP